MHIGKATQWGERTVPFSNVVMVAVLDNGHTSAHCFTKDLSQLHINFARSVLRANTWIGDRYAGTQNTN
jgi:hypothetical protein